MSHLSFAYKSFDANNAITQIQERISGLSMLLDIRRAIMYLHMHPLVSYFQCDDLDISPAQYIMITAGTCHVQTSRDIFHVSTVNNYLKLLTSEVFELPKIPPTDPLKDSEEWWIFSCEWGWEKNKENQYVVELKMFRIICTISRWMAFYKDKCSTRCVDCRVRGFFLLWLRLKACHLLHVTVYLMKRISESFQALHLEFMP